jgi:hypothetical protein
MVGWVRTEVKGWTLAELIDEGQYRLLLHEAEGSWHDLSRSTVRSSSTLRR